MLNGTNHVLYPSGVKVVELVHRVDGALDGLVKPVNRFSPGATLSVGELIDRDLDVVKLIGDVVDSVEVG